MVLQILDPPGKYFGIILAPFVRIAIRLKAFIATLHHDIKLDVVELFLLSMGPHIDYLSLDILDVCAIIQINSAILTLYGQYGFWLKIFGTRTRAIPLL